MSRVDVTMTAKDRLLVLLLLGGYAITDRGWGSIIFGSDGKTYATHTARALERDGIALLNWNAVHRQWEWVLSNREPASGVWAVRRCPLDFKDCDNPECETICKGPRDTSGVQSGSPAAALQRNGDTK